MTTKLLRTAIKSLSAILCSTTLWSKVPQEPVEIGTTPQFFIDDHIVDNRWAIKYGNASKEMVVRVLHQPKKHPRNPLIDPQKTFGTTDPSKPRAAASYMTVTRDGDTGLFRLYYQLCVTRKDPRTGEEQPYGDRAIAYHESKDGIKWTIPHVNPNVGATAPDRNVVWRGGSGRFADSPQILEIPDRMKNGYKYVMQFLDEQGIGIVGSHDGIKWDSASVTRISKMHSDTSNWIVYDETIGEFVMYCRAKDIYRVTRGDVLEVGESRRVARMTSKDLWMEWRSKPQNILLPDERDAAHALTAFYGITVKIHAGIHWGFLQPFRWNTEIESELAFSRDGVDFQRLPDRPKLVELGKEGEWDDGFVLTTPWIDVGDEWWVYYNGWDGPHGIAENRNKGVWRTGGIGLATIRREGLISMRGPENGGVIATRQLRWPGGRLLVNVDANGGEMKARVTDADRKVVPGFDYADCASFTGSGTRHEIRWKGKSLENLRGKAIRLEFFLKKADIYSFVASGG